jgi:hypothetical protein
VIESVKKKRKRFKVQRYIPGTGGLEPSAKRRLSEIVQNVVDIGRKRRKIVKDNVPVAVPVIPPVEEEVF